MKRTELPQNILDAKAFPATKPMTLNELANVAGLFTPMTELRNILITLERNAVICISSGRAAHSLTPDIGINNETWKTAVTAMIYIDGNKETHTKGFYKMIDEFASDTSSYSAGLKSFAFELDKTACMCKYFVKQIFGLKSLREREYKRDQMRWMKAKEDGHPLSMEECAKFHNGMFLTEDYTSIINEIRKCINSLVDRTSLLYNYMFLTLNTAYGNDQNRIMGTFQELITKANPTIPFQTLIQNIIFCNGIDGYYDINDDIETMNIKEG